MDGDGLDAMWGGVGVSPSGVKAGEAAVNLPEGVEAWVRGPHVGERLRHV